MNLLLRVFPLVLLPLLLAWVAPLSAQTAPPPSAPATPAAAPADPNATPPAGSTVITADELRSDQNTHITVFTGSVVVTGTNFVMTCQEMTVNFTKDNKIDSIVATGDVVINQPGRVTRSGRADYFREEDKFVLTDQPIINDHGKTVEAPKITIWRTSGEMQTDGHSKVVLPSGSTSTSPSTPGGAPAPTAPGL